jgi:diadenosine tetraphosphate (Ap4A) HIT family hydrolase
MNDTIRRFGYPASLIAEYEHWVVLLRPAAPTLAALVLAAKGEAIAYGDLPAAAFAEQALVVAGIEQALRRAVDPARINYLMLMMVDPHVHFHVIPRYDGSRRRGADDYPDAGWPKLPDLAAAVPLSADQVSDQVAWLKGLWPAR